MAVSFPSSPTGGDLYVYNNITFTYDGEKWKAQAPVSSTTTYSDANVASYLSNFNYVTTATDSDSQTLSLSGNVITISGSNSNVDLTSALGNVSGVGSGTTTMAGLSDVDSVDTVTTGDVLLHDGSEYKFVNLEGEIGSRVTSGIATANLADLNNVDGVDTVADGDVLLYDSSSAHFGYVNLGSEITSRAQQLSLNGTAGALAISTGNSVDLRQTQFLYSALTDLPSASTYHGAIAHVHAEGALYFAHSGSWNKLQNDIPNIANSAQGVNVTGKVAASDGVDIDVGGSLNAEGTSVNFGSATISFSGASIAGLSGTIKDTVEIGVAETFSTTNAASGVTSLDCNNGHIFYLTSPSADVTANFVNLYLNAEYATNLTVVVNQGATAREVTAIQIEGTGQTINWQGGSAPTGTVNGIDVFSFTILNDGGSYVVLGQMVDFA